MLNFEVKSQMTENLKVNLQVFFSKKKVILLSYYKIILKYY